MRDTGVRRAIWGYVRAAYVCAMRFIFGHFDRHIIQWAHVRDETCHDKIAAHVC